MVKPSNGFVVRGDGKSMDAKMQNVGIRAENASKLWMMFSALLDPEVPNEAE